MRKATLFSIFAAILLPFTASAVELVLINHTGAPMRVVDLFNVCQGYLIPQDQPLTMQNGESKTFEVPLVMHHYKICGSGFCTATSIQLKEGTHFELEMVLPSSGVINGKANPEQWGGPSNPCPAAALQ